jgi:DNA-directed RNA polymerase
MKPMKEFNPMQYLAIDISNCWGLDKLNFEDRIEWVKTNINNLESLTNEAEEPILYYKAVKALRDAQVGKPIGHTVALDSASSGLSLMSTLMRCKSGASLTGLIDPDTRTDAYTLITEKMNVKLDSELVIPRKDSKKALMTAFNIA